MWEQITAVATSVYAGASILLLLGVVVAFFQLRSLGRSQQLGVLERFLAEYRTKKMLDHVVAFVRWANAHRREAPFVYAVMHAQEDPAFMDLHNHRRHMSQLLGSLGTSAELGLYGMGFAVRVAGAVSDDARYLIGVEWRLRRQLDDRDGIFTATTFQRWGLLELFIASRAANDQHRYGRFRKKTWWTPSGVLQRWREDRFRGCDVLPRYRQFLTELAKEPGYQDWAEAGLDAFDRPLSPEEHLVASKRADDSPGPQDGP
jgi:hypothetical protein